jgi:hypothetical protein
MFPNDAKNKALNIGIPFWSATTKESSEENGKIVAAKNAAKNKASSEILYFVLQNL